MALTPQEKSQLPVRTQRLPPGAAEQLSKVPKPAAAPAALPPGARPTITVDSQGRASAATIRPPTAPPLQATPLPTPQPTGGARPVPVGQDGTQARLDQLKAERATRAGVRATQAAGATAAPIAGAAPVGPASPLGAVPPGAPASAVPPATPAAAALGTAPAATPASAAATTLGAPPPGAPAAIPKPGVVARVADKVRSAGNRRFGRDSVPFLLEGANVALVAHDPNATGIDVATQAAEGTGKLASAYAGAKGGALAGTALGGPVGGSIGGLAGFLGGYFGADKVIDGGRAVLNGGTPTSNRVRDFMAQSPAAKGLGLVFPGGPQVLSTLAQVGAATLDAPDSSPVARAPDIGAVQPGAAPAPATAPAPTQDQPGAADVLGTFNGRQITRGEADTLAGQLQVVGGGNGTGIIPAAPARSSAAQLGASVGSVSSSDRRKLSKQLDETLKGLGDLNMRGKRQLAAELLGLKTRLVEGKAGTDAQLATEQARIDSGAAAAQLGADVQREGFQARGGGSPIVGEDGNLYTLQGNTLAPITGADGKPAKAPTSNKEAQALYADLVKQLTVGGETPEQIQAIQQQAAQLSGIGGQATTPTKEGYTYRGVGADGKPVWEPNEVN